MTNRNPTIPNPEDDRYHRRPPRLERVFAAKRPFYFGTFNTAQRARTLACDEMHAAFSSFYLKAHHQYDIAVGRYVLMPDHIHLFVALPPTGLTLLQWVQSLRAVLGKELLRLGVQKPHWQEGFFDHLLRSGDSYSQKWDYVRMNPVRAGLCLEAEDWPHQGEIVSIRF